MYKAIILDFDGTILDSIGRTEEHLFTAAAAMGLAVGAGKMVRLREYFRIEHKNNFSEIFSELWPMADIDRLRHQWQEVEKRNGYALTPGAEYAIRELDAMRLSLHILTSRGESVREIARAHGIERYFASIHSLFDQPYNKPHPRCADALLAELEDRGVERGEILYVGDSYPLDGALARALGIPFIGITAGMHSREQFRNAGLPDDMIIDTLLEILEHI